MTQHVQQQDETHSAIVIITTQQDWRSDAGKDSDGKASIALRKDGLRGNLLPLRLPLADGHECKESEKQGEEHITKEIVPMPAKRQIPRNNRDQCKEKQVSSVLPPIASMQESFYQQESKQRECQPPYAAHQEIPRHVIATING